MKTMKRTDEHKPSTINPEDYSFVAVEYLKLEGDMHCVYIIQQRKIIAAHMDKTGGNYSGHTHGGNCMVCGAWAIYTVLFYHEKSNVYIRTGFDCADHLEYRNPQAFRRVKQEVRNAREAKAGKAKAIFILEDLDLSAAWDLYQEVVKNGFDQEDFSHSQKMTAVSMVEGLIKYGNLSEKQENFLKNLMKQIENGPALQAKWKAEKEAAQPVPVTTQRILIEGTVVSVKWSEGYGGEPVMKMVVKTAEGWSVWGSVPLNLQYAEDQDLKGKEISFIAKIKVSDNDPKFGFFSRPTKAKEKGE